MSQLVFCSTVWKYRAASEFSGETVRLSHTRAEITSLVLSDILVDLRLDAVEAFVKSLLDDHSVKVSGQEHFVVLRRIRVVGTAGPGNSGVQLSKHEPRHKLVLTPDFASLQKHPKLVPWRREVNKHDLFQQETSHLRIAPILRASQNNPELVSQVVQALHSGLQAPDFLASEQQLDTIRQESIVVFSLNQPFEDFFIASIHQSFEDEHERDHVFDFTPGKSQRRTTRVEVMNRVGHGRLVRAHTTNLASVCGVSSSTFGEGRSVEVEGVMTTGKDEVSDKLFVSVDDEVSSERGGLFAVFDQLGCWEFTQITSNRLALGPGIIVDGDFTLTLAMMGNRPQSRISSCSLADPSSS